MGKYFIATYTNWCKEYCDEAFFRRLGELQKGSHVCIVDNTSQEAFNYTDRLRSLATGYLQNWELFTMYMKHGDHQFHYNVIHSLQVIRDLFLRSDAECLLLIESDVIPPVDLLSRLEGSVAQLPDNWGILGALYYQGFHDYTKTGLQPTGHALSGCTVYRREVIEKYPFRIDPSNWAAFPDAWISYDVCAGGKYSIWNDHNIHCEHLHHEGTSRQSRPI